MKKAEWKNRALKAEAECEELRRQLRMNYPDIRRDYYPPQTVTSTDAPWADSTAN